MHLSRREILAGGTALTAVQVLTGCSPTAQESAPLDLPRLPMLDASQTLSFALEARSGETEFVEGERSATLGFGQSYLGPVVRVPTGTTVQAQVSNGTDRQISVHWHGLLIPGDVDGGPHQRIAPGEIWRPTLPVDQPRATLWYHTHIHGETAEGVYAGLAGVLLVDDGLDTGRGLPVNFGVDDLVLVLQDKRLNDAGQAVYEPTEGDKLHGFLGDRILVNGAINAIATVPAGIVKLRLLNASNGRNFDLSFADHRQFHLVATDQGLLERPIAVDSLRLTPGERAEVLVDFAVTTEIALLSQPHKEGSGAMGMAHDMGTMVPNEERFTEPFEVLSFRTDDGLAIAVSSIPESFADAPPLADALTIAAVRELTLNDSGELTETGGFLNELGNAPPIDHAAHGMPGMGAPAAPMAAEPTFGINGNAFDMARVDFDVRHGTFERWVLGGEMMGHPFHIHGARFRVISDGAGNPRPENSGWKDTLFVDGEVEILVQFQDIASSTSPFMFHCHVLEHEDRGMMGQFTVASVTP